MPSITAPTTRKAATGRYIIAFALPCLIAALLAGFSFAVLTGTREQVGPIAAARIIHEAGGGLYGSALTYRPYPYKLALYTLAKPDVALVGSSRALAFLPDGFNGSMITLGGAVNEIAEGERLIPDMLAAHKPKLVIFTLDYWWFNPVRVAEASPFSTSDDIAFSLENLSAPYEWLIDGDVKPKALIGAALRRGDGLPRIGAWASFNSSGFDEHGTRHYGGVLSGTIKHDDVKFKSTLRRVKKARPDSKGAAHGPFSEQAWASLVNIAAMLQQAGVPYRFVLPPFAPPLYQAMQDGDGPTLMAQVHERLAAAGYPFADFSDPASIGSDACEFVDGFHGGFVTYLRITRALAPGLEADPATRGLVRPVADLDALIAGNAGRATLHSEAWSGPEVDFLKLGCKK
jgi:hypothetical protein